MLALALADGAFKNKLTSLSDVYSLVVPSDTDRIRLQWMRTGYKSLFFGTSSTLLMGSVCLRLRH